MDSLKSTRTTVKRNPNSAHYDKENIYKIIDESLICHVGFISNGQPFVIPTISARVGDSVYLHGALANHMLRSTLEEIDTCLTYTLIDGLVMARSAFHHSMHYRSVVVMGRGKLVTDEAEKLKALEGITNQSIAGRWEEVRKPNEKELKQTLVVGVGLSEASAKVSHSFPKDDEEDYALSVWAGVIPVKLDFGMPIDDPKLQKSIPVSDSIRNRLSL